MIVKSNLESGVPLLVNHNEPSVLACRPTHPKDVALSLGYCYPCDYAEIVEGCNSDKLSRNFRQIVQCDTGKKLVVKTFKEFFESVDSFNYKILGAKVPLPKGSWTFDPHRGFSVNWTLVQLPSNDNTVYCFATYDNKKGMMEFKIELPGKVCSDGHSIE